MTTIEESQEIINIYGRIRLTISGIEKKRSLILYQLCEAIKIIKFYEKLGASIKVW